MTDLPPPPQDDDPPSQLQWARQVLNEFSRPGSRHLLGAKNLRALARQILRDYELHPEKYQPENRPPPNPPLSARSPRKS